MVLAPAALQARPDRPCTPLRGHPGKHPGIYCNPNPSPKNRDVGSMLPPTYETQAYLEPQAARPLLRSAVSETCLRPLASRPLRSPVHFRPAPLPEGPHAPQGLSLDTTSDFIDFLFSFRTLAPGKSFDDGSPTMATKSQVSSPPRTELGSTTSPSMSDRSDDESLVPQSTNRSDDESLLPQSTNSCPSTRQSPRWASESESVSGCTSGRQQVVVQQSARYKHAISEEDQACQELLSPPQQLAEQASEPAAGAFPALLADSPCHGHRAPAPAALPPRAREGERASAGPEAEAETETETETETEAEAVAERTRRRARAHACARVRVRSAIDSELRSLDAEMADLTCDLLDLKRHLSASSLHN